MKTSQVLGTTIVETLQNFFALNRSIVLFVYGLTFFVMGLSILLNSRQHSRLRLAQDLHWLAAFGFLHGIHEWGDIFIPIQEEYLSKSYITVLWLLQSVLLAVSFMCLFMFGTVTTEKHSRLLKRLLLALAVVWVLYFMWSIYTAQACNPAHRQANVLARYILCLPGGLLAAYGLRYQAHVSIAPLGIRHIHRTLEIAGWALAAYAIFAGIFVAPKTYFPANTLNQQLIESNLGIPIEVLRSLSGLVLALSIIRALEIFEIEIDRHIEQLEVDTIQATERERIGQEIHDGAIQGVYSASLILESMEALLAADTEALRRLQQAKSVLNAVNIDLRSYMVSLRAESPPDPLLQSLRTLIKNPRYYGLLNITLDYDYEPNLKPMQVHQVLGIVQEALSNILRHARASRVNIRLQKVEGAMRLEVSDNGVGFALEATPSGYGVRSMRDRIRLIGGQLVIESTVGKGTSIILTLPEEKS